MSVLLIVHRQRDETVGYYAARYGNLDIVRFLYEETNINFEFDTEAS